eukprot:Awhi_evm1s14826
MRHYGWNRVGLVTTTAEFSASYYKEMIALAPKFGIELVTAVSKKIFEVAYELGIFGSEPYTWISHPVGLNLLEDPTWSLLENHPSSLQGLHMGIKDCDKTSDMYARAVENLAKVDPNLKLDAFECAKYDSVYTELYALNKTMTYMKKNNVPFRCLQYDYFYETESNCTNESLDTEVKEYLIKNGGCKTQSCNHCGVCHLVDEYLEIGTFSGRRGLKSSYTMHIYQAMMAGEIAWVDFAGASGQFGHLKDGGISAAGTRALFNFKYNSASNTPSIERYGQFSFAGKIF